MQRFSKTIRKNQRCKGSQNNDKKRINPLNFYTFAQRCIFFFQNNKNTSVIKLHIFFLIIPNYIYNVDYLRKSFYQCRIH
jgi:hypothetical protein